MWNLLKRLHRDEGGFLLPLLGIGASLLGASQAANAQNRATAAQEGQIELMREAQDYQKKRQAVLDPLFLEFLRRSLVRSRTAPMIGGLRGRPFLPVTTPVEGLPALPPPQLIGSVPTPSSAPASTLTEEQRRQLIDPTLEIGGH